MTEENFMPPYHGPELDFSLEEKRARALEMHKNLEKGDVIVINKDLPDRNLFKGLVGEIIEKLNDETFRICLLLGNYEKSRGVNAILIIEKKDFIPVYTSSDPILGYEFSYVVNPIDI